MNTDIQNIKLLDTDVLSRLKIIEDLRKNNTILACSTITMQEFIQSKSESNKTGLDNHKEFQLKTMLEWRQLCLYEASKIFNPRHEMTNFPFQNQSFEDNLASFMKKRDDEAQSKVSETIRLHDADRDALWSTMKEGANNYKISIDEINEEEAKLINDIKNKDFGDLSTEDIQRFTCYSEIINKFGEEKFKELCPACYSELRIQAFISLIKKGGKKKPPGKEKS